MVWITFLDYRAYARYSRKFGIGGIKDHSIIELHLRLNRRITSVSNPNSYVHRPHGETKGEEREEGRTERIFLASWLLTPSQLDTPSRSQSSTENRTSCPLTRRVSGSAFMSQDDMLRWMREVGESVESGEGRVRRGRWRERRRRVDSSGVCGAVGNGSRREQTRGGREANGRDWLRSSVWHLLYDAVLG